MKKLIRITLIFLYGAVMFTFRLLFLLMVFWIIDSFFYDEMWQGLQDIWHLVLFLLIVASFGDVVRDWDWLREDYKETIDKWDVE